MNLKKLSAEAIGTFWLVFGGCGTALFAAGIPQVGVGFLGVSLAFGLTVLTMAYTVGAISGGHFNPAVSIGCVIAKRLPASDLLPYIVAQLVGAVVASLMLYMIASGKEGFDLAQGFAANGFAEHSPNGYSMGSAFLTEAIATCLFMVIILGSTEKKSTSSFAPIAIGLALTLIHLITIPITNTSVNPARSFAPAVFVGGWAIEQLWLFWLAPILGAACGAFIHNFCLSEKN